MLTIKQIVLPIVPVLESTTQNYPSANLLSPPMLTIKAATRRITMWRRLPSRLFTSTFKVQLYLSFNNYVYRHLERVGQILQRHQPLFFFLVFWLVLLGFFQLEHRQKESGRKGKKSKAKVSVVAESWEGGVISKDTSFWSHLEERKTYLKEKAFWPPLVNKTIDVVAHGSHGIVAAISNRYS